MSGLKNLYGLKTNKKIEMETIRYIQPLIDDLETDLKSEFESIDWTMLSKLQKIAARPIQLYREQKETLKKKYGAVKLEIIIDKVSIWDKFLRKLFFTYHSEWVEKNQGDEIDYFYIALSGNYGTPCYHFFLKNKKTDLENNHLSYSNLREEYKGFNDVYGACRQAIDSDVFAFKQKEIQRLKDLGLFDEKEKYQVHHNVISFKDICDQWFLQKGGIEVLSKEVNPAAKSGYKTFFTNPALSEEFREFHLKLWQPALITSEEHKKRHKKKNDANCRS